MGAKKHLDWIVVFLFLGLVVFGLMNIYSASLGEKGVFHGFDFNEIYIKQAVWIGLAVVLAVVTLAIEGRFYKQFSGFFYLISILLLLGLFVFGKTIAGQRAWYSFGSFSIQPAEFVKVATALVLARYLDDNETNISTLKHQSIAFFLIFLPVVLILGQPDPGSAMVYMAFLFPLYREGLSGGYLLFGAGAALIFVATLIVGPWWVAMGVILLFFALLLRKKGALTNQIKRFAGIGLVSILFAFSVNFIFFHVFQQHHRDRFNLILGKTVDARGIGYNTHQSEVAIGSGGWFGKGWTKGTQTKGNFVPEQHTDYIFSTVGEEWGFVGSALLVGAFVALICRIIFLAERQRVRFSRVYGYSVAGILFIHFAVNIGMVSGIFPTVGIPLPFLSYGGSSLWGFTLLIFIFLRLDADRKETTYHGY